ncbi:MAG: PorP/SprF family type IX secretion system membrane protein [Bacteroidota bacterium]
MKTKVKKAIILLIVFGGVMKVQSQDIHFSQFWMAPLLQNPALAGANYDLRAIVNYKNQWNTVASPYKTVNLSFDMKLNKKDAKKGFCAAGLNIFNDKAGDANMNTTQGNLSFGYHVILNDNSTLGGGLMAGLAQRSINYSNLQWANQYDGTKYNATLPSKEPEGNNNFSFTDFGGGILWTYNKGEEYMTENNQIKATAGIAVFHPHQPKYSFYNTPDEKIYMKTIVHANVLYGIKNTNFSLVPGFMFYKQGTANELFAGSMIRYTLQEQSKYTGYLKGAALSWGAYYRNKDAVVAIMMLEFSQYAIGVSYDVNVSGLKSASKGNGGIEISLRFVNPNPFLYKNVPRI